MIPRKPTTITLAIIFVVTSVLSYFQIPVLLIVLLGLASASSIKKWDLKKYLLGCMCGVATVLCLTLVSFFTLTKVTGGYDSGGTWVTDRKLSSGLVQTSLDPTPFMAAYVGYDCNTTYGDNCSTVVYLTGASLTSAILLGALAISTKLSRSAKQKSTEGYHRTIGKGHLA